MNNGYNLKDLEDIKKKAVPCPKLCELYYNFGTSTVVKVTNFQRKYVKVDTTTPGFKGTFDYQGIGSLTVTDIKLFSPSLNKYNNQQKAAELIIQSTGGGKNTIFYIPIKDVENSYAKTFFSLWVSGWINELSSRGGETTTSSTEFSLNDIIPRS